MHVPVYFLSTSRDVVPLRGRGHFHTTKVTPLTGKHLATSTAVLAIGILYTPVDTRESHPHDHGHHSYFLRCVHGGGMCTHLSSPAEHLWRHRRVPVGRKKKRPISPSFKRFPPLPPLPPLVQILHKNLIKSLYTSPQSSITEFITISA